METLKEGFARRLGDSIKKSGKSGNRVSSNSGVSRACLLRYLQPESKLMPGSYNLVRLCEELDVSADYLLFGKE